MNFTSGLTYKSIVPASGSLKIIKEDGDHSTRIGDLDKEDSILVLEKLNEWLK